MGHENGKQCFLVVPDCGLVPETVIASRQQASDLLLFLLNQRSH